MKVIFEAIIGSMTLNGDRGLFTQMRIDDPLSLSLLRDNLYSSNMDETRYVLDLALKGGFLANTKLRLHWSRENQLWMSELDVDGRYQ